MTTRMISEIKIDRAQFLELVVAQAGSEGQPLSELEKKCVSVALKGEARQQEFAEIKKQFPSKEAFDEFVARAARLVERALLREVEAQPELTPHARAMMESFVAGGGGSVVEGAISAAMFGRMPPVLRALGIAAVALPLAVVIVIGWRLYADLNGGRLPSSSRSVIETALALVAAVAVWVVLNLLKKISDR